MISKIVIFRHKNSPNLTEGALFSYGYVLVRQERIRRMCCRAQLLLQLTWIDGDSPTTITFSVMRLSAMNEIRTISLTGDLYSQLPIASIIAKPETAVIVLVHIPICCLCTLLCHNVL